MLVDLPTIRANLVNLNCSVIGTRPPLDLSTLIDPAGRKTLAEAYQGTRPVWFGQFYETPVYKREHLPADAALSGPAIIEQMDTTTIVEPGCVVTSDKDGNLIVAVPQ